MSEIFFNDLQIPEPDYHLDVGSGSHGLQTGIILERLEGVLLKEKPDFVIVYGDTNSTLAGALSAAKLHIPVAHVEAGLRSYDQTMPEEINRVVTDHISDLLFCTYPDSDGKSGQRRNNRRVHMVGDVMVDALRHNAEIAERKSTIIKKSGLKKGCYYVATIHRASNTDNQNNLTSIIKAPELRKNDCFPVPRSTDKKIPA